MGKVVAEASGYTQAPVPVTNLEKKINDLLIPVYIVPLDRSDNVSQIFIHAAFLNFSIVVVRVQ